MSLDRVARRVLTTPARCGSTRLVCIDGPSGSGKTVLAGRLAAVLAERHGTPTVVHMDDLYPGWDGLAEAVPMLHDHVVAPLVAGRAARYRRYDWDLGAYAEEHDIGIPSVLVVEGVGAGARCIADHAVLVVWVEASQEERFRRGMARDGEGYRPHWERWARQEEPFFAAEGTRERADLRVDGDPSVSHDPLTEIVVP